MYFVKRGEKFLRYIDSCGFRPGWTPDRARADRWSLEGALEEAAQWRGPAETVLAEVVPAK